jgi:hypothetical protein
MNVPWILIAVLVGLLVVAGLVVVLVAAGKRREQGVAPDYRTFFILGITWLPLGITLSAATDNPGFLGLGGMGLVFLVLGLANRDKWQDTPTWSDVPSGERRTRMALVLVGLVGLLVLGVWVLWLAVR